MKQNSQFEIICIALALIGLVIKTVVDDNSTIKYAGGLTLYGFTTITIISKIYRFRKLAAKSGQKLTIIIGTLCMLTAFIGEAIDPDRMYNALWFLGMLVAGLVSNQVYKANQAQTIA